MDRTMAFSDQSLSPSVEGVNFELEEKPGLQEVWVGHSETLCAFAEAHYTLSIGFPTCSPALTPPRVRHRLEI